MRTSKGRYRRVFVYKYIMILYTIPLTMQSLQFIFKLITTLPVNFITAYSISVSQTKKLTDLLSLPIFTESLNDLFTCKRSLAWTILIGAILFILAWIILTI